MKQFHTIEKIDTRILYILGPALSISILLLAFGLIASMANGLTKGWVLTDNLLMQHIWAGRSVSPLMLALQVPLSERFANIVRASVSRLGSMGFYQRSSFLQRPLSATLKASRKHSTLRSTRRMGMCLSLR